MRKLMFALVLAVSVAGCHKNVTFETPKAAHATVADDVVVRVNELQAALIQVCGPAPECAPTAGFSTDVFRQAIKGFIDLRTTLKAAPEGWLASAKSGWAQLKPRLAMITNPVIVAALAAVDAVLGGL